MRDFLFWVTTLYVAVGAWQVFDSQPASGEAATPSLEAIEAPSFSGREDPAQEICATGCSIGNHPITPLTLEEYRDLLTRYALADGENATRALETLLFHGEQVRGFVKDHGLGSLDGEQASLLRRELQKKYAAVWMRVVDEHNVVRAQIEGARFPIGKKEHVHVENTINLPAPEISGTVHRTSLHHLWTRI